MYGCLTKPILFLVAGRGGGAPEDKAGAPGAYVARFGGAGRGAAPPPS